MIDPNRLSWDCKRDSMIIEILYDGQKVMSFCVEEILDTVGRKCIMDHVRAIGSQPWISSWHS